MLFRITNQRTILFIVNQGWDHTAFYTFIRTIIKYLNSISCTLECSNFPILFCFAILPIFCRLLGVLLILILGIVLRAFSIRVFWVFIFHGISITYCHYIIAIVSILRYYSQVREMNTDPRCSKSSLIFLEDDNL